MPPNDSSSGGFLSPTTVLPPPYNGLAFNDFLQAWVVGVTQLPGALVRPRWQPEPPVLPNLPGIWAAVGVMERRGDRFPYIGHNGDGQGADQIIRNEELDLLCSFYDLGTNGLADLYGELMRDGAIMPQNREYLKAQNYDVGIIGDLQVVPSLLKVRWMYRVDLPIQVRRQVVRQYPVLNIESFNGTIICESGLSTPFSSN